MGKLILWGLAFYGGFEVVRHLVSLEWKLPEISPGTGGLGRPKGASSPLSVPRSWRSTERDNVIGNWASTSQIRPPTPTTDFRSDGIRYI